MRGIGGTVEDRGNVVLVLNPDLPAKGFNFACKVDAGDTSKDQVIDYVVDTFRGKGLTPHFQLWSITRPSDFGVDLWQRGFQEDGELDVMVWKKAAHAAAPEGVIVRSVEGDAEMATAVGIVLEGFGFPPEWKDVLLSSLTLEPEHIVGQTFLAEVDGKPAGVAALVRAGERISGIYSVATRPPFRRRGVATALSLRCIDAFKETGDEALTLQVKHGSDAQRLYERLGFETAYAVTLHTLP
jgi:GNAT superfamily N-acetyltransferase